MFEIRVRESIIVKCLEWLENLVSKLLGHLVSSV